MNHLATKPYLVDTDNTVPEADGVYFDWKTRKTDYYIFMSGEALPKPDVGNLTYSQDPSTYDLIFSSTISETKLRNYDYLDNNTPAPLLNSRALGLLKTICPDCFQAFPVTIVGEGINIKPYRIENEYWLINITKLVDTIDLENSHLKFDEKIERIRSVKKLRFIDEVKSDPQLILARERLYHSHIIASQILKDTFEKNKIKGCRFITDEEYNLYYF